MLQNTVDDLVGKKTKGLEFLIEHEQYFSTHSFGDVPEYLMSQIECFENCSLLNAVWSTHTTCKKIVNDAEQYIHCIFTQPPFLLADVFYAKIEDGIKLKLLFGKNSDIPECNDLVDKLHLDKPKLDTRFEKRICDHVATNIIMSESRACVMLPDNNGMTDVIVGIEGHDKPFLDWCESFFDYKWNGGEQFARLR